MRDASVFARPLNRADPEDKVAGGKLDACGGKLGLAGDKLEDESELKDWDLDDIGTVRLLRFLELVSGGSFGAAGSPMY